MVEIYKLEAFIILSYKLAPSQDQKTKDAIL